MSGSWVDIAALIMVAFTTTRGYGRGLVRELAGIVALAAAIIVPWFYNGALDAPIARGTGVDPAMAHFIGTMALAAIAYVAVLLFATLLGRVRKVPILGFGNAIGGAIVGFVKGAILVWLIIYVALFFPLTPELRANLHESRTASVLDPFNRTVDSRVQATIPPWALPWFAPYFKRHHV